MLTGANDDSKSPETRESIPSTPTPTQQSIEYDALVEIVAQQAQSLNDVILSCNNLQSRVAALESAKSSSNGKKGGLIALS